MGLEVPEDREHDRRRDREPEADPHAPIPMAWRAGADTARFHAEHCERRLVLSCVTASTGHATTLQPLGFDDAAEKAARPVALGVGEDLGGRSLLLDPAFEEEHDLARHVAREAHL